MFVLFGILLVSLWFKLRAEEQLLTQHFPEAYPRYRHRVRGLIPFVLLAGRTRIKLPTRLLAGLVARNCPGPRELGRVILAPLVRILV